MHELEYTLTLASDAEPGTGLGCQLVDDRVPRDTQGLPFIPASHLKGLMRENLRNTARELKDDWQDLVNTVMGRGDNKDDAPGEADNQGLFNLGAARMQPGQDGRTVVRNVSRTAVDPRSGGALDTSLRTTECISAGTKFHGRLYLDVAPDSPEATAIKLSLLSICAIGGGVSRGSGQCTLSIKGENATPGSLLRQLVSDWPKRESASRPDTRVTSAHVENARNMDLGSKHCMLRLTFIAEAPVCCPETPVTTGVVRSGFVIPSSAVQGALLTRLSRHNTELATACYFNPGFRAWPMIPIRDCVDKQKQDVYAIRVSLTHRVAKLSAPGNCTEEDFQDEAISPYDWTKSPDASPLKAMDGVLLLNTTQDHKSSVSLWKSADMPRVLSAHGVMHDPDTPDNRNLYQVEAMAPLVWQGLVSMPEKAAGELLKSLEREPRIAFGRGRGVRGMGRLQVTNVGDNECLWPEPHSDILVVQSPILLPGQPQPGKGVQQEFREMVEAWLEEHHLPALAQRESSQAKDQLDAIWGCHNIRFGWNRLGLILEQAKPESEPEAKAKIKTRGRRLAACRTIEPGAVIKLAKKPGMAQLANALAAGLGQGRERGFGALAVHPGRASGFYSREPRVATVKSPADKVEAIELVLRLHRQANVSRSQVYAVQQRLEKGGKDEAINYLKRQEGRTEAIWADWNNISDQVEALINKYPDHAAKALRVLADLVGGTDK